MLTNSLLATAASASIDPIEAVAGDAPKTRLQLLPLGRIECCDGRVFDVGDATAAAAIVALSLVALGPTDMVIDYDHHSNSPVTTGARAEAAGWIDRSTLSVEADGIYGTVEWTPAATAKLAAREYRYLSPHLWHAKDGKVLALRCAGLVNIPAIKALAAVASAQFDTTLANPETMMLSKIAAALGLPETATEDEVIAAIAAMKPAGAMMSALASAASELGLAETATLAEVLAAGAKPDAAKFAPMTLVTSLQARLKAIEGAAQATAAATAVDALIAAGKLPVAERDWGLQLHASNLALFATFAESAAVLVADGEIAGGKLGTGAHGLTTDQLAVCSAMGIAPEAFARTLKEDGE